MNPPPHAAPCLRVRPGQRRARALHSYLGYKSINHQSYRPIFRAGPKPVQRVVERLIA
jgi:hypothetical protein